MHQGDGIGRRSGYGCDRFWSWSRGRRWWRRAGFRDWLRGCVGCTLVLGPELGQQGQIQRLRQGLDFACAIGQSHRTDPGGTQFFQQGPRRGHVGGLHQAAKINDHGGACKQLRGAFHAFAHFLAQTGDIQGADTQVGNADLADLQLASLLVIGHGHAYAPARWCGREASQGRSGKPGPSSQRVLIQG